jgi:GDPmannose 4,6-dehydratase
MKALITGINGQDGSYLAEYLLSLGYDVYGIIRRHSVAENQSTRLSGIFDRITLRYGDIMDHVSIDDAIREIQPDEIYNLAAQSHVRIGADIPIFTAQNNAIGFLNVIEAYRRFCPQASFYQASSSEQFGTSVDHDGFQRESTPMDPVSIYGISKVFCYNTVRYYREAYKLHACNGILFNHESIRRGSNFVTQKVVQGACRIKKGLQDKLELGNLDSYRDWGHAKDYVRAMHLITNHIKPMDFIVSTGETHSVREMCKIVFGYLDLDYNDYIVQNEKYLRPEELPYLRGDCTKIKTILGWKPEYNFESLLKEMVNYWMNGI